MNRTVRAPRHSTVDSLVVNLQRSSGQTIPGDLCNISRRGAECRLDEELDVDEHVTVCFDVGARIDRIEGRVQWCRNYGTVFAIGIQFDKMADWETIGELFLLGILKTDSGG